jgi:radical SAM protein with 4Fe4S-binding SPASM domain
MDRLDLGPHLDELGSLVERLLASDDPMVMFDPAFGPLPPGYIFHDCVAGEQMLYLDATGDVYPCTSLLAERFLVGTVRTTPLEELWLSPEMNAISRRARALTPGDLDGECATCSDFEGCHGACRGVTHAHTGDLGASFPRCLRQVRGC